MKITNIVTSAALMLGSAALMHAQVANYGDLIAGFEASSGTGAATNIEVDVGSVTNFISAGPGVYSLANLSSDLTATYGASWATDSALGYGIVGAVGTGANNPLSSSGILSKTIWASNNSGSVYVSPSSNNTAIGAIGTMYTPSANSGGFGGSQTTMLSDLSSQTNQLTGAAPGGLSESSSNGGSYTVQDSASAFGVGGATDFTLLTAVNSAANTSGVALNQLNNINAGNETGTSLNGTFTLTSAGILEFVVIPEPSTYAAILGIISIGFVMLRRRNKVLA